jgi:two-component system chemotaxis response regulator CheB
MQEYNLRPKSLIQTPKILAIGSSTGGLRAIMALFESLRGAKIEIPIIITQHLPQNFDNSFADKISNSGTIQCFVAKEGMELESGKAYIAPAGYHMIIKNLNDKKTVLLDPGAPVNYCRPAVDPMFESVADCYGKNTLAIILTGIGSDGTDGSRKIIQAGGTVIAQDKSTSVVWGMPASVAEAGLCTAILPINEMGDFLKDYSFGKIR